MEPQKSFVTGQFSDAVPPILDGVASVAHHYAEIMDSRYGRGYLIGPKFPGKRTDPDYYIRFSSLPIPGSHPYRIGLAHTDPHFLSVLRRIPFSIVHSHSPFIAGDIALRISRTRKVPLVTTFHTQYREDLIRHFRSWVIIDAVLEHISRYFRNSSIVLAPNSRAAKVLGSYGYEGPVKIIPNGTDMRIPDTKQMQALQEEGRKLLGIRDDRFTMLFVGQHRWEKNPRLILEGLYRLSKCSCRFQMLFAGTGPDAEEIKALAETLQLNNCVRFLGPIPSREVLRKIYAVTDLLVFPSLYDTASLTMREAASFGIPSLVVEESVTADGITDGINGFLTENTPEAFAGKLGEIISLPGLRKEVGRGAQKTIYIHWEQVVHQVHELYMELLKR